MVAAGGRDAMTRMIKSVCIVGGGAAGWLTAGLLAARRSNPDGSGLQVTLIESEQIGIIGVGEGTWPTMRNTLKKIGISETQFVRSSEERRVGKECVRKCRSRWSPST